MRNIHRPHTSDRVPGTEGCMGDWVPYYDFIVGLRTLGREHAIQEMTIELAALIALSAGFAVARVAGAACDGLAMVVISTAF